MLVLYLIRHGEAVCNVEGRMGRSFDSPLTEKGKLESKALGQYFRTEGIRFHHIFSSPIKRAKDTARLACEEAAYSQEIILEPNLVEISRGEWDGKEFVKMLLGDEKKNFEEKPADYRTPGGETENEVKDRMAKCIAENILPYYHAFVKEGKGKFVSIAAFSHGVAIRSFLSYVLGCPIDRLRLGLKNTAVSIVVYDGQKWILKSVNSIDHLNNFSHKKNS